MVNFICDFICTKADLKVLFYNKLATSTLICDSNMYFIPCEQYSNNTCDSFNICEHICCFIHTILVLNDCELKY